jgi:hypothetical protein
MFNALVIPLSPKIPEGWEESRVELRSADDSLLFSKSYESKNDREAIIYGGRIVLQGAWTPDSKFFVYNTINAGGHQVMFSPIYFIEVTTLIVRRLDDYVGEITERDFTVGPPDIVYAVGRSEADLKNKTGWTTTSFEVRLSKLVNRK